MKKLILVITLLMVSNAGISQENLTRQKKIEWSLQTGGIYNSFQDVKYSNVQYNGIGGVFQIGHVREYENTILSANISMRYAQTKPNTFEVSDLGFSKIFYPNINLGYLRKVKNNLYVGGRLDALDVFVKITEGAGNNGFYLNSGFNLFGSVMYRRELKENLQLVANADLGLFSFFRESTGFAYSAPQNVTENGEFNFQDDAVSSPFGLKFYEAKAIWSLFNLQTSIGVKYKERWTFSYTWSLRRFATVREYPTTFGIHGIIAKFNFINKLKPLKK